MTQDFDAKVAMFRRKMSGQANLPRVSNVQRSPNFCPRQVCGGGLTLVALLLGGCQTQAPQALEEVGAKRPPQSPRAFIDERSVWSNAGYLTVCWDGQYEGRDLEMGWVRDAVEKTWERAANVNFVGWLPCSQTRGKAAFPIRVFDDGPYTLGLGSRIDHMLLNFDFQNWGCSGEPCNFSESRRQEVIRSIAVHEFGHALGLSHEQNRPDTPASCLDPAQGPDGTLQFGEWDNISVMNYCARTDGLSLSDTDRNAVQFMYGARQAFTFSGLSAPSQFASSALSSPIISNTNPRLLLTAQIEQRDTRDLVAIFETADKRVFVNVHANDGRGGFVKNSSGTALPAPFADRIWVSGDADGDGRDELHTFMPRNSATQVWSFPSGDTGLAPERYSLSLVEGDARSSTWKMGDTNADARADLWRITPQPSGVLVQTFPASQEGRFSTPGFASTLSVANPQSLRWELANVDNDGRLDLVSLRFVNRSVEICSYLRDASGLSANPRCSQLPLDGQAPQVQVGDYNGDGRMDVAVLSGASARLSIGVFQGLADGGFTAQPRVQPTTNGYWRQRAWTSGQLDGRSGDDLVGIW